MCIATALIFIALAATEFALMRVQLIVPENDLIQPEIFNRLMTLRSRRSSSSAASR